MIHYTEWRTAYVSYRGAGLRGSWKCNAFILYLYIIRKSTSRCFLIPSRVYYNLQRRNPFNCGRDIGVWNLQVLNILWLCIMLLWKACAVLRGLGVTDGSEIRDSGSRKFSDRWWMQSLRRIRIGCKRCYPRCFDSLCWCPVSRCGSVLCTRETWLPTFSDSNVPARGSTASWDVSRHLMRLLSSARKKSGAYVWSIRLRILPVTTYVIQLTLCQHTWITYSIVPWISPSFSELSRPCNFLQYIGKIFQRSSTFRRP